MTKRIRFAGLLLGVLVTSLATAATAGASVINPPVGAPPVVCIGSRCVIHVGRVVTHGGGPGRGGRPIPIPPPPCRWLAIGDAVAGSNAVIQKAGPDPTASQGISGAVIEARQLLKKPLPGEWFALAMNPAATPAEAQECQQFPAFAFIPPGSSPPVLPVPPGTIAAFAYNSMRIPQPRVTVSPTRKGYVNLASYVWGSWPPSRVTGREDLYRVSATAGGETVTVQARAAALSVVALGPGTAYSGCGPNGSRSPAGHAPASAGAGTPPDCGVLWSGPDTHAGIIVTARWTVTWWQNNGPRHALPDIVVTAPLTEIPVNEIQSINNGG
jgi:hypothetical protein